MSESAESEVSNKKSILFVCLCNICRSPTAEAVFRNLLMDRKKNLDNWKIDSAGLVDWHAGEEPDIRGTNVLKSKGIVNYTHIARQITMDDLKNFYWIMAIDFCGIHRLGQLGPPDFNGRIELLGKYDPQGELVIRDPFYDEGDQGYVKCYEQCVRACNGFLDKFYQENP